MVFADVGYWQICDWLDTECQDVASINSRTSLGFFLSHFLPPLTARQLDLLFIFLSGEFSVALRGIWSI